MIAQSTIDKVYEIDLYSALDKYLSLKKTGAGYSAKSPFTDEKSASFLISPAKSVWKCFSTGKGGSNAIQFLMAKDSITWIEAIKQIAADFLIPIEYDDSEVARTYQDTVMKKDSIYTLNAYALQYFIENLEKLPVEQCRATPDIIDKFSIGFSPNEWDGLMKYLYNLGVSAEEIEKAGLGTKSEKTGKLIDFFRGRIMFPIFSISGKIIGFSGRDITGESKAKYLNSKDTLVFTKSDALLGLYQSREQIQSIGKAVYCEGNFDMTSLNLIGMTNSVATVGSAMTDSHARLLRKYTDSILKVTDRDSAGLATIEKDTKLLLRNGFSVMIFIPGKTPKDFNPLEVDKNEPKMDIDDFIRNSENKKEIEPTIRNAAIDAIYYLAEKYYLNASTIPEQTRAKNKLIELIACIPNHSLRNSYIKAFAKEYDIKKQDVEEQISNTSAERKEIATGISLPNYINETEQNDFKEFGFYEDNTEKKIGYHFATGANNFEKVSNFVIKPYFQLRNNTDSKRIVQIKNNKMAKLILLPNKAMSSAQIFEEMVMNYGNFNFIGNSKQFKLIRSKLLGKFPIVDEITTLGWQQKGFYAFADGIVHSGNFHKIDTNGIVVFDDQKYYLPAFSQVNDDITEDNDIYEADRYFQFRPGKITIRQWSEKMIRVHDDNGKFAILFMIATIYKDHIMKMNNWFPILFGFGLPQTGKSTCARSINSIFFDQQPPFLLPSGTATAFNRRLARVKNAVTWFDEYTNNIDERRFQAIKGSFDGTGHEKGVLSNDNKTIQTKINSGLFLTGQTMPTRDQYSLHTRCIILTFTKLPQDRTEEDNKAFDELTKWEREGLSNLIIEVVKYRDLFENEFQYQQFEFQAKFKRELANQKIEGRIMNNWVMLVTISKILGEKLNLPFTWEYIYQLALVHIVNQSEQVSESNDTATFWNILEYLSFQNVLKNEQHYIVKDEIGLKLRSGEIVVPEQGKPTMRVLYISLKHIYPFYMEQYRRQFGENGIPEQSLKSYITSSKEYIGTIKMIDFNGIRTSAFAFNFDLLDISLKDTGNNKNKADQEDSTNNNLPF